MPKLSRRFSVVRKLNTYPQYAALALLLFFSAFGGAVAADAVRNFDVGGAPEAIVYVDSIEFHARR